MLERTGWPDADGGPDVDGGPEVDGGDVVAGAGVVNAVAPLKGPMGEETVAPDVDQPPA